MEVPIISMQELKSYKYHSRLMELRLSLLKATMVEEYGVDLGMANMKKLSEMFQCNWGVMAQVLNSSNKIMNIPSHTRLRRQQEIILMGHCWDETRHTISKRYLNVTHTYLYQNKLRSNPEFYVTEEWADILDNHITILTHPTYINEVKKFLISFEIFVSTFTR